MDALDRKHAKSVLLTLYSYMDRLPVVKSKLNTVVKSHQVLDNLLSELVKDKYIKISEMRLGPPKYLITLTELGVRVAIKLKEVNDLVERSQQNSHQECEEDTFQQKWEQDMKCLSTLYHVNVYQDHITIGEEKNGVKFVHMVYVTIDGRGVMRLWCEDDDSFSCIHSVYAWTLSPVQEMYEKCVREGRALMRK